MTKQGVVRTGTSPSAVSSKPADMIKAGEAVLKNERAPKRPETLASKVFVPEEELKA